MLRGLAPLPSCKVADITCVKAFSSWIVSLAVLKDCLCFWRIYKQKNADNVCSDFPLFFLMSGKKRALVFSFQFPTVEPWEDYVILGLESSAACGVIPSTEYAKGAFYFLAVIEEWQAHTFPPCDKVIPLQWGLLCIWQPVYWLPHTPSLHDLLFLFQKVKYSGWFLKNGIFFFQEYSYHSHQKYSSKHFREKASRFGEKKIFLCIWPPFCLSWHKGHQTSLIDMLLTYICNFSVSC